MTTQVTPVLLETGTTHFGRCDYTLCGLWVGSGLHGDYEVSCKNCLRVYYSLKHGGSPNSENLRVAVGPFVHPNGNAGDAQQMDGAVWRGHRDSRPGPFWSGEPEQDFLRAQLAAYYDSQAGEMRMRIITDTTNSLLRFLSEPLPASSDQLCDLTFQLLDCLHQQIERVRQVRVGLNDLGRSDVAADTSGGVAHNDSSTSAEQPESVPAITVEAKRRGDGDSCPCARGGAA